MLTIDEETPEARTHARALSSSATRARVRFA
jgi:hypothetical protein